MGKDGKGGKGREEMGRSRDMGSFVFVGVPSNFSFYPDTIVGRKTAEIPLPLTIF